MRDLIDRTDLLEALDEGHFGYAEMLVVKSMPSVPSVQVVTCGECRFWKETSSRCKKHPLRTAPTDFCSDGKEKDKK